LQMSKSSAFCFTKGSAP